MTFIHFMVSSYLFSALIYVICRGEEFVFRSLPGSLDKFLKNRQELPDGHVFFENRRSRRVLDCGVSTPLWTAAARRPFGMLRHDALLDCGVLTPL